MHDIPLFFAHPRPGGMHVAVGSIALVFLMAAASVLAGASRPQATLPPASEQTIEAGVEWLGASDIDLTQSAVAYEETRGRVQSRFAIGHAYMGIDYKPVDFDFLGYSAWLSEYRWSGVGDFRVRLSRRWNLSVGGAVYEGFGDYRSVWLDEYYRQQFESLDGYLHADPGGASASAGVRWEYLPATGNMQLTLGWARDQIAPGYEIDFTGLHRGQDILSTPSVQLTQEQLIGPRVRVQNQLRLAETTGREPRWGWQSAANIALGEDWICAVRCGYAAEDPSFESWFGAISLEYEILEGLSLLAGGRYYTDTGEIENTLFSTAAPGLDSWQMGGGVRWIKGRSTFRVQLAIYQTEYAAFGLGTAFFANLYQNRDWHLAQFAYSFTF